MMTEQKSINYGQRLRYARELRGLKQAELGEKIGVRQSTIGRIEGKGETKSVYTVEISLALNINPIWLDLGRGEMELINNIVFNDFLSECYLHTIKKTLDKEISISQITSIAEALFIDGLDTGEVNVRVSKMLIDVLNAS